MYTVNFVLKNNPNALTLVFKANKNAEDLYKKAAALMFGLDKREFIQTQDDFETKLSIGMSDVAAVSMSEYEKDMDKNMDLQIIQHKATLKAQSKARTDVGIQMLEGVPPQVMRQ